MKQHSQRSYGTAGRLRQYRLIPEGQRASKTLRRQKVCMSHELKVSYCCGERWSQCEDMDVYTIIHVQILQPSSIPERLLCLRGGPFSLGSSGGFSMSMLGREL